MSGNRAVTRDECCTHVGRLSSPGRRLFGLPRQAYRLPGGRFAGELVREAIGDCAGVSQRLVVWTPS